MIEGVTRYDQELAESSPAEDLLAAELYMRGIEMLYSQFNQPLHERLTVYRTDGDRLATVRYLPATATLSIGISPDYIEHLYDFGHGGVTRIDISEVDDVHPANIELYNSVDPEEIRDLFIWLSEAGQSRSES